MEDTKNPTIYELQGHVIQGNEIKELLKNTFVSRRFWKDDNCDALVLNTESAVKPLTESDTKKIDNWIHKHEDKLLNRFGKQYIEHNIYS